MIMKYVFFILFSLSLVACGGGGSKGASKDLPGLTPEQLAVQTYGGKWRRVDNGAVFYISSNSIGDYHFLSNGPAPEGFRGTVLKAEDENLLVRVKAGEPNRYYIRDGIRNTLVTGEVARPQSISSPGMVGAQRFQSVGGLNVVLRNTNTEETIQVPTDGQGTFSTNNVPTGTYEISTGTENESFSNTLTVSGAESVLGVLNIAENNNVNFKVNAAVGTGIFRDPTNDYQYSSVTVDKSSYTFYRDQYVFPLGDLSKVDSDEQDATWISLSVKNISENVSNAVTVNVLCDENAWVLDCGRKEGSELNYLVGTINPGDSKLIKFWLKVRPFNAESKNIVVPVKIQARDASGVYQSLEWRDSVTIQAFKKAETVVVNMSRGNDGYVLFPGRKSLELSSSNQYIKLPFIKDFEYSLLYANDSASSQANYSIAVGQGSVPEPDSVLAAANTWAYNFEPNGNEAAAKPLLPFSVNNAYLDQGDLDYYKIKMTEQFNIVADNSASQSVLEDVSVSALKDLSFTASLTNSQVGEIRWQQIRGPAVDFEQSAGQLRLRTPMLTETATVTFMVAATMADDTPERRDYLSITILPFSNTEQQSAATEQPAIVTDSAVNLVLRYSNNENASNQFLVRQSLQVDNLTLEEGVTLKLESGTTLTVRNNLIFAGAEIVVDDTSTLDMSEFAKAVIPVDSTLVLDGDLTVAQDLTIRGKVTHSQRNEHHNGVVLNVPGTLRIDQSGLVDVTGKGLGSDGRYGLYYSGTDPMVISPIDKADGSGSGGSFGTLGGRTYMPTYGDPEFPELLGSGGSSYRSGYGGGRITINAGDIQLNGSLLAEGESDSDLDAAGSGGSILITLSGVSGSRNVSGTGYISTRGGFISTSAPDNGGHGRIAIKGYASLGVGDIRSYGSLWLQGKDDPAGTLYLPEDTSLAITRDMSVSSIEVEAEAVQLSLAAGKTLTFKNTAATLPSSVTFTNNGILRAEGDLTLEGTITHSAGNAAGTQLDVAGKLHITDTGLIDISGKGRIFVYDADQNSQGGSHGGLGIKAAANSEYGQRDFPRDIGAAGKSKYSTYSSGSGGGAVYIKADQLQLDGNILAKGADGYNTTSSYYGAGAGGSVLIELSETTGSFSGSGAVSVSGGTAKNGIHGGGGRIAVLNAVSGGYNTDAWTGFNRNGSSNSAPENGTFHTNP
ncbi:hypothetical protein GJQ54_04770 [Oceanospirillaceae bacterium ASx5O]|nr:hypothetical protein GJQ54_04770 [Oceanospirillaceae bacterium ASx5O]